MTIFEIGGYASAMIALMTLVGKVFDLIRAIQQLIHRLDTIQETLQIHQHLFKEMTIRLNKQEEEMNHLIKNLEEGWIYATQQQTI